VEAVACGSVSLARLESRGLRGELLYELEDCETGFALEDLQLL